MKIFSISLSQSANYSKYNKNNKESEVLNNSVEIPKSDSQPYYLPLAQSSNMPKTISFLGKLVHIVDGGVHANNMQHFMKTVKASVDIQMHDVSVNNKDRNTKQLKSAYEQLKNLNDRGNRLSKDYIAIPILASVPLLNLQDQYSRVMGEDKEFTPENIKANKADLLKFLKRLKDNPERYSEYISYMDPIAQGIEYSYGIIEEINKLVKKCPNVYLPSGHPNDATIKWMADQRNLKPELYNYISSGVDVNNSVETMKNEIRNKNWYNFNLLALSDARIVGLKSSDWKSDYIYSAYDSCVNDSARGVYNLSPIRDGERVVGFGYMDEVTNNYPYEEFPSASNVSNLLEFVGKNKNDVAASEEETELFVRSLKEKDSNIIIPNKLYRVEDVFSSRELDKRKINIQGKYVNKDLSLFFDENKDGKIVFKKCDCEGSSRPSVMPIWGSCYSMMNAIARDIGLEEDGSDSYTNYENCLKSAKYSFHGPGSRSIRMYYANLSLNIAEKAVKKLSSQNPMPKDLSEASELLGAIYYDKMDMQKAESCFNTAIDILAKRLVNEFDNGRVNVLMEMCHDFPGRYNSGIDPDEDLRYDNIDNLIQGMDRISKKSMNPTEQFRLSTIKMSNMYKALAKICRFNEEFYPTDICNAAAKDLEECTPRAVELIKRRADGVQYIGDLYNEIKSY